MRGFYQIRRYSLTLFFLFCLVVLPITASAAAAKMPHFKLTDVASGSKVDSSAYSGKAKLVVFFATWCMPCMQEVPSLMSLQEEYAEQGFTVVAISVDNRRENVEKFVARNEVNYPVLLFDRRVVDDFGGIPGLPTTFVVDRDDNVLKKYPGLVPHALLEREVKQIIGLTP